MGCDIHIVLESRKERTVREPAGKWIGVYCTDYFPAGRPKVAQRDYAFFGAVANVRGSGDHYPKNVPEDISELAWREYMRAPTDYHSASHMPMTQFIAVYQTVNKPADGREQFGAYDLMGADHGEGFEYRVVFWFDN